MLSHMLALRDYFDMPWIDAPLMLAAMVRSMAFAAWQPAAQ
jgi:hypothetical protein